MKVLITGGLGTIGSCLAKECLKRGYKVTILDDYSIGKKDNLKYYLSTSEIKKIKIIKGSVLDKILVDKCMKGMNLCFHMAALLGTLRVVHHPFDMVETNIIGTHNVLKSAQKYKVKIVVPSTSMVYGNNPKAIVNEKDDCFVGGSLEKGLWWYAITKMADESATRALIFENKIQALIIRPFNVVGPIQSPIAGFVIPRFVSSAMKNQPIPIYGEGKQKRTFIWVEDFVSLLFDLIDKNVWNKIFNIGSTSEISIFDLAQKIISRTNSKSKINYINPDKLFKNQFVEINRRIPDVGNLKNETNFSKKDIKNIDFIIDQFVEYYKKNDRKNLWTYKPYF